MVYPSQTAARDHEYFSEPEVLVVGRCLLHGLRAQSQL